MASSFWKGVVGLGLFALAHAAFSAAQRTVVQIGTWYFLVPPGSRFRASRDDTKYVSHALREYGFSLMTDRSYMRLTEKENETLPIDIVLQTLLAFVVTCCGIVHISGEFKDMDASSELKHKTFDTLRNHPSFYLFNHRGRVLFSSPEPEAPTATPQALPSNPLRLRKLENFH